MQLSSKRKKVRYPTWINGTGIVHTTVRERKSLYLQQIRHFNVEKIQKIDFLAISKTYNNFIRRLNLEVSGNSDQRDLVSISKNYEIDLLQISNCFRTNLEIRKMQAKQQQGVGTSGVSYQRKSRKQFSRKRIRFRSQNFRSRRSSISNQNSTKDKKRYVITENEPIPIKKINQGLLESIAKRKIEETRKRHPELNDEEVKANVLIDLKKKIKNSYSCLRHKKNSVQVKDLSIWSMLYMFKPGELDFTTLGHSEEKYTSNTYRYSYEFLKNLREKYLILKEKLTKQMKQVHERKLDLSEFTLKISKFKKLISEEMRQEMKDFAFQSEADSSFELSSNSSGDNNIIQGKRKKETNSSTERMSIWEKIDRRNKEAKQKIPAMRYGNKSVDSNKNITTSFSRVNKEYNRFLARRKEKVKNVKWLEKQLKVAREKKIIFESQAKLCYDSLIKNSKEYEKYGMIRIIDEMIYFGFTLSQLKMPSICEEDSVKFIVQYCKWKWEVNRVEIDKKDQRVQQILQVNKFGSEIKLAYKYVIDNVRKIETLW